MIHIHSYYRHYHPVIGFVSKDFQPFDSDVSYIAQSNNPMDRNHYIRFKTL